MIVPLEVRFYLALSGSSPVERYVESLEAKERVRVLDALDRIRTHGFTAVGLSTRQIDGKLWEIKVSRHRLFYVTVEGPIVVLLHAYQKQGRKAPKPEIDVARTRMKEVLDG